MSYSHINRTLSATGIGRWSCDRSGNSQPMSFLFIWFVLSRLQLSGIHKCPMKCSSLSLAHTVDIVIVGTINSPQKVNWLQRSIEILPSSVQLYSFCTKKNKNKKHQNINIFLAT